MNSIFTAAIFLLAVSSTMAAGPDVCLGLVMEGGGDKGAYEAGVLRGFATHLPSQDVQYDVVSGISVGALNSAFVSRYPIGQENKLTEDMVGLWLNIKEEEIFVNWPGGLVEVHPMISLYLIPCRVSLTRRDCMTQDLFSKPSINSSQDGNQRSGSQLVQ